MWGAGGVGWECGSQEPGRGWRQKCGWRAEDGLGLAGLLPAPVCVHRGPPGRAGGSWDLQGSVLRKVVAAFPLVGATG